MKTSGKHRENSRSLRKNRRTFIRAVVALLSVATSMGIAVPGALAAATGPDIMSLSPLNVYSNSPVQNIQVVFDRYVSRFTQDNIQLSGTAMNCEVRPFDQGGVGFVFAVDNCSDGTLIATIVQNSVKDSNDNFGPADSYSTEPMRISRAIPDYTIANLRPISATGLEFDLLAPFGLQSAPDVALSFGDSGCTLSIVSYNNTDVLYRLTGCSLGAPIQITISPYSIPDFFGNVGPVQAVVSTPLTIDAREFSVPSPPTSNPGPDPTSSAAPSSQASAGPGSTASPSPSSTASTLATPPWRRHPQLDTNTATLRPELPTPAPESSAGASVPVKVPAHKITQIHPVVEPQLDGDGQSLTPTEVAPLPDATTPYKAVAIGFENTDSTWRIVGVALITLGVIALIAIVYRQLKITVRSPSRRTRRSANHRTAVVKV